MTEPVLLSRKSFLGAIAGSVILPQLAASEEPRGKLLIVAAHPDDEYAFAAATYRLVRESGWTADQVIVTNGESGYRYSTLAEAYYGVSLTDAAAPGSSARTRLIEIRKKEARNAGDLLGIRRHYFLDQQDLGFDKDAATASTANWNRPSIRASLAGLLQSERYDAVFTLLPTAETHGHHRAATLLTLESVNALGCKKPLVFGVDARGAEERPFQFTGLPTEPLTRTVAAAPVLTFDRATPFGFRDALSYRIVVNWLIAEHKSQGLFQTDTGQDRFEQFWLFEAGAQDGLERLSEIQKLFCASRAQPLKGTTK